MPERIQLHFNEIITTIAAILGAFGLTRKAVRLWVTGKIMCFIRRNRKIDQMIEQQGAMAGTLNDIKSFMYEQTRRQELNFRMHELPAFECDRDGNNTRVSDSYLEMLGLRRESDLKNLDWRQFIHQDHADKYFTGFLTSAHSQSDYSATIEMLNSERESLGKKNVRIFCVTPNLFIGYIKCAAERAA